MKEKKSLNKKLIKVIVHQKHKNFSLLIKKIKYCK